MDEDIIIESSEPVKIRRSKVADPESWNKNVRKKLRNTGQAYMSVRGQYRTARQVRPKDCSNCKKACNTKFPEAERQKIHKTYWALGDNEKQKLFISTLVEEMPVAAVRTKAEKSRRSVTRQYFFRSGRTKLAVCKGFFLATLDISETVVSGIVKNRDETSYFPRESLQGKTKASRGRPEEVKELIRQHIRSYIQLDYTPAPASPKKKRKTAVAAVHYIPAGLNAKRLYEAYVQHCQWNDTKPEKLWLYREILTKDFNVKFEDIIPKEEVEEETREEVVQPTSSSTTIYYEEY